MRTGVTTKGGIMETLIYKMENKGGFGFRVQNGAKPGWLGNSVLARNS